MFYVTEVLNILMTGIIFAAVAFFLAVFLLAAG
jgi:hypothetical protein